VDRTAAKVVAKVVAKVDRAVTTTALPRPHRMMAARPRAAATVKPTLLLLSS
jgi:hypothetical protein